ncbi:MAG: hypothetical protein ACMUIU_05585 [bacterium]
MFKLSDIRKLFILLTITFLIMFIIPNLAVAGHGGMGGGMGMSSMGGCCGGMSSYYGGYYGGYYPTTTASWLGGYGYSPYATTIGSPYSAYGYSPYYNTRIGSLLGTSLGGYGGLYGYGGGVSNTYTTYVPGGQISTTVPSYGGYGYGLLGGGLTGLGAYGLGGGYGYNPYSYGLGTQWI